MTSFEIAQRYFSDRGVHEETFKHHQIEIVLNPSHDQLVGWLGENSYCLEAAIVFPNLTQNPDTAAISTHSYYVRCFPPPVGPDGKERKFLSTLGSTYRPYILLEFWTLLMIPAGRFTSSRNKLPLCFCNKMGSQPSLSMALGERQLNGWMERMFSFILL